MDFDRDFIKWFFISLGILIGVILLAVAAIKGNARRVGLLIAIGVVILFLVLGAIYFPFIMICIVGGVLFIFSIATVAFSYRLDNLEGSLRKVWNPRKAFGGAVFGDVANAIGVLAGMGASRVFSEYPMFWWIGHVGALMAMTVGVSLLWRGAREKRKYLESYSAPSKEKLEKANRHKIFALFNFTVGLATWLSLMIITPDNRTLVQMQTIRWFWFIFSILLLLYLIPTYIYLGRTKPVDRGAFGYGSIDLFSDQPRDNVDSSAERVNAVDITLSVLIGLLVAGVVTLSALFLFKLDLFTPGKATIITGVVASIIGICFWIASEGYNWIVLTVQWNTDGVDEMGALDYMVWEKNLWEVVGALTTIVFLSAVLADAIRIDPSSPASNATIQTEEGFEIVFIIGAVLGFFGTVRGILSGILNRFQGEGNTFSLFSSSSSPSRADYEVIPDPSPDTRRGKKKLIIGDW